MSSHLPAGARRPVATAAVIGLCLAAFAVVQFAGGVGHERGMRAVGWAPASDVWQGRPWALVASAFVHTDPLHLLFNVYWIWKLGPALEREIGAWRFVAFYLTTAFVSSSAELAFADQTGIGASGAVYGIFGLMWVGRSRSRAFADVVTDRVVRLMLGWIPVCYVLTWTGILSIGNAAHAAGLAFGVAVGAAFHARRAVPWTAAAAVACVAAAATIAFWCPWQPSWAAARAMTAHRAGDHAAAESWYERSRVLGGDARWVLDNLALVHLAQHRIDAADEDLRKLRDVDSAAAKELEQSAYWAQIHGVVAHQARDYAAAERWYRQALERGGEPAWCWANVARVQIATGQYDEARTSQARLRELDAAEAAALDAYLPK